MRDNWNNVIHYESQASNGLKEWDYDQILDEIQKRDYQDSHRSLNPLRQAEDAEFLDTSDLSQEEVIEAESSIITARTGAEPSK